MKKYWLIIFTVFLFTSCKVNNGVYLFSSFHEPATEGLRLLYSKDTYHWTDFNKIFIKPEVGGDKIMRDASITQGPDGTFHLVWTTAWKNDQGFGYASSKDLIHWSQQQHINVMAFEPTTINAWAPELFYDEEGQQFIIVWASCVPNRFTKGEEDENNNHRLYYTTTKDFKTFAQAKLFLDPGFSVIDAEIVKRGKDDYILVMKDNTRLNRNIKVGFSNHVLGPYTNISAPVTPMFSEGPTVAHTGNNWLIYYDAYRDKKFGAVKTNDFITFMDASNQIIVPQDHKHGTIFKVSHKVYKRLKRHACKL